MTAPQTASQFLDTLGVNVHVEYTDGKYANATNVVADLAYLGETHVRDAVLNPSNQGQSSYDVLAAAGIKFDMFLQGTDLASTLSLMNAFVTRHPGAIALIEGPNEVNNFPISYQGQSGNAAATAYQAAMYSAVKGDALLSAVPVADLTSWPFLAGPSDYANYHFYPFSGAQPQVSYGDSLAELAADEPGKPMVMTEGGYNTLLTDGYYGGVDELTQAKLTLNLYCDNARDGVVTTYLYQLLDAYADPTNSNNDSHFGLFHLDNTPKLAATAIHNLTSILASGAVSGVTATTLSYTLANLPSLGAALTLTKNATTHDILVWNEPNIWDAASHSPISVAAANVTVHLAHAANVVVFDPLTSSQAVASYTGVQDVVVSVSDHPLIVEVTDIATVATPAPAANHAPVLAGAVATSASDHSIVTPFVGMTISDADTGQAETVTVTMDPAAGSLSGGGFAQTAAGVYQVTAASAAAAQADLRALTLTPVPQPSGSASTQVGLKVVVSDGAASATDTDSIVTVSHTTNTPVVLGGVVTSQSTLDTTAAHPFAAATVSDPDLGQTETVTVSLSTPSAGSLAGGGFTPVAGSPGVYRVAAASAAQAQADLRALQFTPAPNLAAAGASTVQTLAVQVSDGSSTSSATVTDTVVSVNDAPILGLVQSAASLSAGATVVLQPTLTLTDADFAARITSATVAINGLVAGDALTTTGLPSGITSAFDATRGVLTFSGTGSDVDYAQALRAVTFHHDGAVDAGARVLTLSVTDDGGATATATESLAVSSSPTAPVTVQPTTGTVGSSSNGTGVSGTSTPPTTTTPATTPVPTASSSLGVSTQMENLLRVSSNDASLSDSSSSLYATSQAVKTIAAQLDAGKMSVDAAQTAILHLADATTSVAQLSYAFFTGRTPTAAGLSYLVHSDANSTDLNDSYYSKFSLQNRYINFSVALAKSGGDTAQFHASFDSLDLADATAKAYASIFGTPASADKISAILNAAVSDGVGGLETRAQYFAGYGGDGQDGAGTKGAMIGWLLAEGVVEGVGVYQAAETNFLQSLAHGSAQYGVDLLATYQQQPTLVGQATLDPTLGH